MTPAQSLYVVSAASCAAVVVAFVMSQFMTYGLSRSVEIVRVDPRDQRLRTGWCGANADAVVPGNGGMLFQGDVDGRGKTRAHLFHVVSVARDGVASYYGTREGFNFTVEFVFDRVRRVFHNSRLRLPDAEKFKYKKLLFIVPCDSATDPLDTGPNRPKYELTIL